MGHTRYLLTLALLATACASDTPATNEAGEPLSHGVTLQCAYVPLSATIREVHCKGEGLTLVCWEDPQRDGSIVLDCRDNSMLGVWFRYAGDPAVIEAGKPTYSGGTLTEKDCETSHSTLLPGWCL